jgi:hypothetical protein
VGWGSGRRAQNYKVNRKKGKKGGVGSQKRSLHRPRDASGMATGSWRIVHVQVHILDDFARPPSGFWDPTQVRRQTPVNEHKKVANANSATRFVLDFEAKFPEGLVRTAKAKLSRIRRLAREAHGSTPSGLGLRQRKSLRILELGLVSGSGLPIEADHGRSPMAPG